MAYTRKEKKISFDLVQGDVLITINYSLMSFSIYGKMFWCECACVDDLLYCFAVTLDMKCLYLLIEKPSDENFVLAGSSVSYVTLLGYLKTFMF